MITGNVDTGSFECVDGDGEDFCEAIFEEYHPGSDIDEELLERVELPCFDGYQLNDDPIKKSIHEFIKEHKESGHFVDLIGLGSQSNPALDISLEQIQAFEQYDPVACQPNANHLDEFAESFLQTLRPHECMILG